MVASGLPDPRPDHAEALAELAMEMLEVCEELSANYGEQIDVRIGIHTGPAVAGVIGTSKYFYDVWGDTVNTAARMESHGVQGVPGAEVPECSPWPLPATILAALEYPLKVVAAGDHPVLRAKVNDDTCVVIGGFVHNGLI